VSQLSQANGSGGRGRISASFTSDLTSPSPRRQQPQTQHQFSFSLFFHHVAPFLLPPCLLVCECVNLSPITSLSVSVSLCKRVCACVCVCERGRMRGSQRACLWMSESLRRWASQLGDNRDFQVDSWGTKRESSLSLSCVFRFFRLTGESMRPCSGAYTHTRARMYECVCPCAGTCMLACVCMYDGGSVIDYPMFIAASLLCFSFLFVVASFPARRGE
jgi:hypothetical protein